MEIDKRKTAIHEAGHAVVALAGRVALVRLNLRPCLEKHLVRYGAYRGRTKLRQPKSKVIAAAIGYAGVLAEMLYEDFDFQESEAFEYLDLRILVPSPADDKPINRLHPKWRPKALKLSVRLLKQHWVVVRGLAFELYTNRRGWISTSPSALAQKQWMGLL